MSVAARALRQNQNSTFGLQITSMIDMFTIILVFLLKSYTASSIDIAPTKSVNLPISSSSAQPIEALKLMVTPNGVYVDDNQVVAFENGQIPKSVIDASDTRFIRPLFNKLNEEAEKSKKLSKAVEEMKFEGKVIFQADQTLNYQILKKIMYTAAIAGYSDVKLAVVQQQ